MKKFISLLLILVIVLTFIVACDAPDTTDGEKSDNSSESNKESSDTSEVASASSDANTIVVWAWDKVFNVAAYETAATMYKKDNPDVTVNIVEISQDDTVQKMNTILASGTTKGLPNTLPIEDMKIQNFLISFTDSFVDMTDKVIYDDFAEYKQASMSHDDKLYGIPFDTGAAVFYYRLDLIEQAGYTENDMKDLTWDKFLDIARAVSEKTDAKLINANPTGFYGQAIALQSAKTWYTDDEGKPTIKDNAAFLEIANVYKTIIAEELSYPANGWDEEVGAINSGKTAGAIIGCWYTASILQGEDQKGNWRITNIPKLTTAPSATNYSNNGGGSIYVFDNLAATETALDFVLSTFGSNKDFYEKLLNDYGIQSTFLPIIQSDIYDVENEFFGGQKIYREIGNYTEMIPSVNYGKDTIRFQDAINVYLPQFLDGSMTAADVANAAQKDAESMN